MTHRAARTGRRWPSIGRLGRTKLTCSAPTQTATKTDCMPLHATALGRGVWKALLSVRMCGYRFEHLAANSDPRGACAAAGHVPRAAGRHSGFACLCRRRRRRPSAVRARLRMRAAGYCAQGRRRPGRAHCTQRHAATHVGMRACGDRLKRPEPSASGRTVPFLVGSDRACAFLFLLAGTGSAINSGTRGYI